MKKELSGILAAIILIAYSVPLCIAVSESSGNSLNAEGDDTLYFQTVQVPYAGGSSLAWLMNVSMPSGQAKNSTTQYGNEYFVSPPLLDEFTFQTITLTMYHDQVPSGKDIFALYVFSYFIDTGGTNHYVTYSLKQLTARAEVDSLSIDFNRNLLQGEKILLIMYLYGTSGAPPLNMYWGNSTYPSQISYTGNVFVPEFPSFLILPLLMITTLVAVFSRFKRGYTLARGR